MSKNLAKNDSSLPSILMSDSFKRQIMLALPKHLSPDRFLRVALTELRKNKELATCNQKSFLGAIVQCSQLGLEPGDNLGRAYLIPYNNRKLNIKECQLIIGYRGLLDLARRSGNISSISSHCVFENDTLEFEYGIDEKLKHIPSREDRGIFVAAYAIAKFKDGGYQFEVMFKDGIDKIRASSKAADSSYSPWATHYEEMAKKTVLRRLCKYLPMSIEVQQAVTIDELGDVGKQDLGNVIDITPFEEEEDEPRKEQAEVLADKLGDQ